MSVYRKAAKRLANLDKYAPGMSAKEYEIASQLATALHFDHTALSSEQEHELIIAYLIESAHTEVEEKHLSYIPRIMTAADFPEDSIKALITHLC